MLKECEKTDVYNKLILHRIGPEPMNIPDSEFTLNLTQMASFFFIRYSRIVHLLDIFLLFSCVYSCLEFACILFVF